jgi:hypothetical protein
VPILGRLAEQIEEAGPVAYIRIGSNAQVTGNGVGGDEPNAEDICGQLIGITCYYN